MSGFGTPHPGFKNSELLTKLSYLWNQENKLLQIDYDWEIEQLKNQIAELNQKIKVYQAQDEFPPLKEQPDDFEPDLFTALKEGKVTSIQFMAENQGINLKSKLKCFFKYEYNKMVLNTTNGDANEVTPFWISCYFGHLDVVRYLCIKHNIDKETPDKDGLTPFFVACQRGNTNIVKYLCERQYINKEAKDNFGRTPFYAACFMGQLDIVEYLHENQKINIEEGNNEGITPFIAACKNDQVKVVQYLRDKQSIKPSVAIRYAKPNVIRYFHQFCFV